MSDPPWSTRVLTIVGKLVSESVGSNGVRVDDGSITTGDHCPDASFGVQDSEFEGSTSGAVELLDVSLFLGQVTTKGGGPDLFGGVSKCIAGKDH